MLVCVCVCICCYVSVSLCVCVFVCLCFKQGSQKNQTLHEDQTCFLFVFMQATLSSSCTLKCTTSADGNVVSYLWVLSLCAASFEAAGESYEVVTSVPQERDTPHHSQQSHSLHYKTSNSTLWSNTPSSLHCREKEMKHCIPTYKFTTQWSIEEL